MEKNNKATKVSHKIKMWEQEAQWREDWKYYIDSENDINPHIGHMGPTDGRLKNTLMENLMPLMSVTH